MNKEIMAKRVLVYRMVLLILFLIGSGLIAGGTWWVSILRESTKSMFLQWRR